MKNFKPDIKLLFCLITFLIPFVSKAKEPAWYGKWMLESSNSFSGIDLSIKKKDSTHFSFEMKSYSGSSTQPIKGDVVINGQKAIFDSHKKWDKDEKDCQFEFELQSSKLVVTENEKSCEVIYGGAGVYNFIGNFVRPFKKKKVTVRDFIKKNDNDENNIFENELEWKTFSKLIGHSILFFNDCLQDVVVNYEKKLKVRVSYLGVAGVSEYTDKFGIILIGPKNQIWAAVNDTKKGTVKYFTNVSQSKKKLPKAIDQWRERFKERKVEFINK